MSIALSFLIGNLNREHGGAQQLLADLCIHLPDDEFDITVYYMFGDGTYQPELEAEGVEVVALDAESNFDIAAFPRLVSHLRTDTPDILHTNSPISGTWGRVAATVAGVPNIVSVEHNMHHTYRPLAKVANGLTLPLAGVAVGVSNAVTDSFLWWERQLLRDTEIRTIVNGVDVEAIRSHFDNCESAYDQHTPFSPSDTIIGTVGRMTEQKGFEHLIRAVPMVLDAYLDVRFLLLGDGPQREELEALAVDLGVGDVVHFTGYVPEVYPFFPEFTVAAFPSLWEGLPLAPAECMVAGKPLVVSDIPPFRELLGDAGVLVPPGEPSPLAEGIVDLLDNQGRRKELAERAAQRVAREFSIERTVEKYAALYRELVGL